MRVSVFYFSKILFTKVYNILTNFELEYVTIKFMKYAYSPKRKENTQ